MKEYQGVIANTTSSVVVKTLILWCSIGKGGKILEEPLHGHLCYGLISTASAESPSCYVVHRICPASTKNKWLSWCSRQILRKAVQPLYPRKHWGSIGQSVLWSMSYPDQSQGRQIPGDFENTYLGIDQVLKVGKWAWHDWLYSEFPFVGGQELVGACSSVWVLLDILCTFSLWPIMSTDATPHYRGSTNAQLCI